MFEYMKNGFDEMRKDFKDLKDGDVKVLKDEMAEYKSEKLEKEKTLCIKSGTYIINKDVLFSSWSSYS